MTLDEARAELRRLERMVQSQRAVVATLEAQATKDHLTQALPTGPLEPEPLPLAPVVVLAPWVWLEPEACGVAPA